MDMLATARLGSPEYVSVASSAVTLFAHGGDATTLGSSLPCSWANEGFLGVGLADLVRGPMKLVLASNYMMDFKWLLSACPDLRNAQRLLLVHGERAGSAA